CVDSLVAGGADVNLPAPEGVSPIMIAIENGHNGIARLLMERGGNPHVWDVYGRTALYLAIGEGGGAGGRGVGGAPPGGGRGAAPGAGAGRGALAGRGAGAPANNGPQVSGTDMVNLLLVAGV